MPQLALPQAAIKTPKKPARHKKLTASQKKMLATGLDIDLIKGNSLQILPGVEAETYDCIWTDPPYHLSNGGTTCIAGKRASVNKGKWDASAGLEQDLSFCTEWVKECARVLRKGGSMWVSGTIHVYPLVAVAMQRAGLTILNDIVWAKTNPPPNLGCRCFTHASEILLWAAKGRGHTFHYKKMRELNGHKQMKSVWQFPATSRKEKQCGKHPTQKPMALVERCLAASTNKGDCVLDPFAGSGTTGLVAHKLGLRATLIESNSEYVDLTYRRMQEVVSSGS